MVTFHSLFFSALAISLCLASVEALNGGFSVELIHRDSPKSPFYDPQETTSQRVNNALRRSISRVNHFNPIAVSPNVAESEVIANQGEYLMSLSVGTPPFEILAIADTGSDLIWTQCEPCTQCYKQDAPLFDPKSSTTYRDVTCSSSQCQALDQTSCSTDEVCQYSYSYGDQSYTRGNVAVDTVTLGSTNGRPVSIPKTIIGCGHSNDGTFSEKGSGIIGLGGGPVSLITQLGSTVGGKFSYCLVPYFSTSGNTSKLNFGSNGIVSGAGVVSTPIVPKDPDTFYYLTLEAISVGTKRIEFSGSSFGSNEGNIIIDSGTTLTLVPQDFYSELSSAVASVVDGQIVSDPNGFLSLCYSATSDLKVPTLTAHFTGADVELKPSNTFVQVSEDVACFAFSAIQSGAIYGNIAQMDFLVGYDLQAKTLSFKPTDCTKH